MAGGLHRGRLNKKAPVCKILLLMCMFIPTLTLLQPLAEQTCPNGEYLSEKGICCNKCLPGFKLVEMCLAVGQKSNCTRCPAGQYTDQPNFSPNCRSCRYCSDLKNEVEVFNCTRDQNTICQCKEGYYKSYIDSETYQCLKCRQCGLNEKEKQTCTPEKNTVCECTEKYYRVNRKCEPCKYCTTECEHHCSVPTLGSRDNYEAPEAGKTYLIFTIIGVIAVALVLLVLGVVITHIVTKWSTKKKLLISSSQSSDISPDSCKEILIPFAEPSNNTSVNAASQSPVNEQEQSSSLPDCVPKIPDLIYTVLDLVPVLQVKQLVRSLGVKDVEIEQAELDYRSCREAHYQMLRLWAERGSRAGGVQHRPLLQELLNELRKIHLGLAAEELETKYSIQ